MKTNKQTKNKTRNKLPFFLRRRPLLLADPRPPVRPPLAVHRHFLLYLLLRWAAGASDSSSRQPVVHEQETVESGPPPAVSPHATSPGPLRGL